MSYRHRPTTPPAAPNTRPCIRFRAAIFAGALSALVTGAWPVPSPAPAATVEVAPVAGSRSIQRALDRVQPGDTVLVLPGDYEERLVLPSGVTLRSRDGALSTRILGDYRGSVILVRDADSLTRVEGFTVTRGRGTYLPDTPREGGGGLLAFRAAVRVRDNIFVDNVLEIGKGVGGAVALFESPAVLEGNTFEGNSASNGGGLYARACSLVTIRGNRFLRNHADYHGGGVFLDFRTQGLLEANVMDRNDAGWGGGAEIGTLTRVEVRGNTIVANRVEHWGGGLFFLNCRPLVVRNLLAENISANQGGGLVAGRAAYPDLRCNLAWHNTPENFYYAANPTEIPGSSPPGEIPGAGQQIEEDPGFCNYLNGNFHPRPGGPADREPCGVIGALAPECPRPAKILR
ncbi:MAG: right-handed parallel beta-helix repeat-containing protein [Candidatus Eisenbacteria bacterium]|nr:right-handed parallel beta-helix repeat-containing protein [Candidatus Eisenbacteria bacterium]